MPIEVGDVVTLNKEDYQILHTLSIKFIHRKYIVALIEGGMATIFTNVSDISKGTGAYGLTSRASIENPDRRSFFIDIPLDQLIPVEGILEPIF